MSRNIEFTEDEQFLIHDMCSFGCKLDRIAKRLQCSEEDIQKYIKLNTIIIDKKRGARKFYFNRHYFNTIDTEDKAYWLGFLYADGCVMKNNVIQISLQRSDRSHLIKFLKCVNADDDYNISDRIVKLNNKNHYSSKVQLFSKEMRDDLINLGCVENKSLILKRPSLDEWLIPHFIRGYFDGDGGISFNNNTKASSVSIAGTEDVLEYIKEKSDISDLKIGLDKLDGHIHVLQLSSVSNKIIFYRYIYENATIYLDRKKEKYDLLYDYLKNSNPDIYNDTFSDDPLIKHTRKGIPIVRISKDFQDIKIYESVALAGKEIGKDLSGILNKIRIKNPVDSHKYYWLKYSSYVQVKDNLREYIINYFASIGHSNGVSGDYILEFDNNMKFIHKWNNAGEIEKYYSNNIFAPGVRTAICKNGNNKYRGHYWYKKCDYVLKYGDNYLNNKSELYFD